MLVRLVLVSGVLVRMTVFRFSMLMLVVMFVSVFVFVFHELPPSVKDTPKRASRGVNAFRPEIFIRDKSGRC